MRYPVAHKLIPTITGLQRSSLHTFLTQNLGLTLEQIQEAAAHAAVQVIREQYLTGNMADKGVMVLAGSGMNGGIALAAARRLHTLGVKVRVCHRVIPPQENAWVGPQIRILQQMGVLAVEHPIPNSTLILDGLMDPAEMDVASARTDELIQWANQQIQPILSLELPAGLDGDTGNARVKEAIRSSATIALGLPVKGLLQEKSRPHSGEILLADIGIPKIAWSAVDIDFKGESVFGDGSVLRIFR